ncbi:MAG: c-type cytochrome [Cyanobium sp.]
MAGLRRIFALLITLLLVFWPRPAWGMDAVAGRGPAAVQSEGARLFDQTCAGCHPNGGNIIRRDRSLRESALRRQGIDGAAAVAHIAAAGIGRMDGYAAALGEGGAERVGTWVWQQALADWPRQAPSAAPVQAAAAASALDAGADFAISGP